MQQIPCGVWLTHLSGSEMGFKLRVHLLIFIQAANKNSYCRKKSTATMMPGQLSHPSLFLFCSTKLFIGTLAIFYTWQTRCSNFITIMPLLQTCEATQCVSQPVQMTQIVMMEALQKEILAVLLMVVVKINRRLLCFISPSFSKGHFIFPNNSQQVCQLTVNTCQI